MIKVESEGEDVVFEVNDEGKGMKREVMEKVLKSLK